MFFTLHVLCVVCCWMKFVSAHRLWRQDPGQVVLNTPSNGGIGASTIEPETVNIPLDHTATNPMSLTFPNRFFVKPDWYKRGGPVFFYDGGEGPANDSFIQSSKDTPYNDLSFFEKFLKNHSALGIVWEHRFYGKSLPHGLNKDNVNDFKFLTTKQALADVAYFAKHFSRSGTPFTGLDLTPIKTPWIFFGCSYPGSRAALMRVAHPDIIFASYASSAPVQAVVDMRSYYEPIWSGMRKYGYTNCTADMHEAIVAIDSRLSKSPADAFKIKQKLFGCTDPPLSNGKFASYLSSLWSTWQGYGMGNDTSVKPPTPGLLLMCDYISLDPKTGTYSDARGWAKVHPDGVDFTLHRLRSWPGFRAKVSFNEKKVSCPSSPPSAPFKCAPDTDVDDISWKYQYCTEWGYFQVANIGDSQIVSKYYDVDYYREQCLCQFKNNGEPPAIPKFPKVDSINKQYGGWAMRPSRTFWTVGEFDPWRSLSPLTINNETVPKCEASTAAGAPLFGKILKNHQHCGDFAYDEDPEAMRAHELFSDALKKWLCCFVDSHKGSLNDGAKAVLCTS